MIYLVVEWWELNMPCCLCRHNLDIVRFNFAVGSVHTLSNWNLVVWLRSEFQRHRPKNRIILSFQIHFRRKLFSQILNTRSFSFITSPSSLLFGKESFHFKTFLFHFTAILIVIIWILLICSNVFFFRVSFLFFFFHISSCIKYHFNRKSFCNWCIIPMIHLLNSYLIKTTHTQFRMNINHSIRVWYSSMNWYWRRLIALTRISPKSVSPYAIKMICHPVFPKSSTPNPWTKRSQHHFKWYRSNSSISRTQIPNTKYNTDAVSLY